jgi:hypothetical protein
VAYRKSLVQVRFRLRKEALRKLEQAAKRHDRSANDELTERLEESFRQDERAELERVALKELASESEQQGFSTLIMLAALGTPVARRMSMAAVRTKQGKAAALHWLSMEQRAKGDEEELRKIVDADLAKHGKLGSVKPHSSRRVKRP